MPAGAQSSAQQTGDGRVAGTVVDRENTRVRMQGAVVAIEALNLSAVTDREGRYLLRNVPAGEHELLIRYIGREPIREMITVEEGEVANYDARLARINARAVEEIIVSARLIADSEAAALSRQAAADSVKNILASDSIGRFPDQNAADALGRVSGISIERDQGQARFVNVRGAPADFSNIAFNGVAAPTPSRGGRSARFDTISNDIIKSIEIVKAVTPDVPADSIGGYINIETSGPFDRPGFNADVSVGGGIKELGGGFLENYQAKVSNTFFDDTLGFLASGSFFSDDKVTDNVENRWRIESNDEIWSREIDWRNYQLTRENVSLNLRADWRPTDTLEFYANMVFSEFTDFEERDRHEYDLDDSHFGHIRSRAGYDPSVSTPTSGTILGVSLDGDFNIRSDIESVMTSQFGGSMFIGQFSVDWVGGFNRSESERHRDSAYWEYEIPRYRAVSDTDPTPRSPSVSMTYDYADRDFPEVQVYETVVDADGNLSLGDRLAGPPVDYFVFEDLEISDTLGRVDDYYFQFDVETSWAPFGIASDLKFGARSSMKEATLRDTDLEVNEDIVDTGVDVAYASIIGRRPPPTRFPQPLMYETDESKKFAGRDVVFEAARANSLLITQNNVWENFYEVDEDVHAAYVMNTFRFDRFDIVAGLRVEYTKMAGLGNRALDESAIDDVLEEGNREIVLDDLLAARNAAGNPILEQFKASDSYFDIFPALHINYRPREDLVLRLAYTQSILRPSYSQFAPNQVVGEETGTGAGDVIGIDGGNPDLDPYRSKNIDAYIEWYLPHRGILSFGTFWKWIDDPIFSSTQRVDGAPFGFPNNEVRLSGPLNGSDGRIKGFEAAYSQQFGFLPEPFDGFGVSLNYTYSKDSAKTPPVFNEATGLNDGISRETGLTGASRKTYNASVFFERYGISTRLAYQYRSEWLNRIDLGEPRLDRYWDARPSLDFSFRYSVNDNWMLFLDANNLTNERGRRFNGEQQYVYELEGFGRSFMTGVRFSM